MPRHRLLAALVILAPWIGGAGPPVASEPAEPVRPPAGTSPHVHGPAKPSRPQPTPPPPPPGGADGPLGWHFALFTGEMRAWFPEGRFEPELPDLATYMSIYEVSQYPYTLGPTPEQEAAAADLVERSLASARRHGWLDFDRAVADGFELMFRDDVHYAHRGFATDGITLDPERPEFLMYYDTERGKRLVGFMYLASSPAARGPQVGGPATVWHYHLWAQTQCLLGEVLLVGEAQPQTGCREGEPAHRSPEMLHVWLIDHPEGPFATNMLLPPWLLRQAAPPAE